MNNMRVPPSKTQYYANISNIRGSNSCNSKVHMAFHPSNRVPQWAAQWPAKSWKLRLRVGLPWDWYIYLHLTINISQM